MGLLDPHSPLNNTVVFYIILIIGLIIVRPQFMYCYKNNKFKPFGYGENKTILPFSIVSITGGIILYIIFSLIDSVCSNLQN